MSTRVVRFALASLMLTGAQIGCDAGNLIPGALGPAELSVTADRLIGTGAPYSGVLLEGTVVVCTSRQSEPGTYEYAVDGDPSIEKFSAIISMQPGECRIAAVAKNNFRKASSFAVLVTPLIQRPPDTIVLIDSGCSENCALTSLVPTLLMSGEQGSVAKFYFTSAGVWDAGNHGGTGTLTFSED